MWKTLNKHHKRLVFAWCWSRGKPKDTSIDDILKLIEDGPGARRDTGMIEGQCHAVVKLLWNCHQWRVLWPDPYDPWCCYIWCSMDPIKKYPLWMLVYIPAPWILWMRIRVPFHAVCCVSCDGQSLFISCACAKAAQGPRCGGVVAILAAQRRLSWGVLTGWLGFPTNVLYLVTTYQPQSYMYIYIDAVLYPYQWPYIYIYCTILNISVTWKKTKHTWITSKKDVCQKRFRILPKPWGATATKWIQVFHK